MEIDRGRQEEETHADRRPENEVGRKGERERVRDAEREGEREGRRSSSLRGTHHQAKAGSGSGQVSIASLRLVIFLTAFQSRIVRTDVSSFPTHSLAHPSVTQITCHILRFQLEENDSKYSFLEIAIDMRKGKARQGKARQGKARHGNTRLCKARQGKARLGKARHGMVTQGKARKGKARHGQAW